MMAKLTKTTLFTTPESRPETPLDKTTHAVTKIIGAETEQRQIKTARLRKARLEREASARVKANKPATTEARAKPRVKANT